MAVVRLAVRGFGGLSGRGRVQVVVVKDFRGSSTPGDWETERYSLKAERILRVYRVRGVPGYVVEYVTENPGFELYRRSAEAARFAEERWGLEPVEYIEASRWWGDHRHVVRYRVPGFAKVCEYTELWDADDYIVVSSTCPDVEAEPSYGYHDYDW